MPPENPCPLSLVVPVYNESASLDELVARSLAVFEGLGFKGAAEILFVDDGSTDGTPQAIARLMARHPEVRRVRLRRNHGKSLALMAGFRQARGEVVVTMDGDLQDSPEDVPALLAKIGQGYDLVNGWRQARCDMSARKLGSRLYNATVRKLSGLGLKDMNCGLKAYRRQLVKSLCVYGQYHRYIPLQAHLAGFKVAEIPVVNSPRKHGCSKYATFRYQGLFDLLSLLFTHRYALNPLHFFGLISLLVMIPSLLVLLFFVGEQCLYWLGMGDEFLVANRPLLAFALTAFLFSMVVFFTGFVCDFILHHQIRSRIDMILGLAIEDGPGDPSDEAG